MICLGNVTLEIEIIKKCFVKLFPNIQVAISSIYTRNFECLWQVLFFNSFYTRSITRGFVGDDLLKCRCHYPLKRHVQVGILFPIVLNLVICFLVLLFIERYWSKERVSQNSRNIFLAECFYEGRPFGSHLLCNLETHCLTLLHHTFVPRFVRLRSWMNEVLFQRPLQNHPKWHGLRRGLTYFCVARKTMEASHKRRPRGVKILCKYISLCL